jgi:cytochrome c-type biogenesis protein CcmE
MPAPPTVADNDPVNVSPARPPPKAPMRRRRNYGPWIGLAAVAGLIAVIGSTVRGSAFVYSKYVDEVVQPAERARWVGRTVRVEGLVAPASIEHRPGTREFRFRVTRNEAVLPVTYAGIVPDTFRDCAGVTVRGVLGQDGVFRADEIVAKCPSKYEAATVVNGRCVVGVAPERGPRVR